MASSAADDQPIGLFSGVWSRLRAAVSGWRRRGENEGEEAIARSRLARRRLGRKLAFVSFNLEVLVFIYAFWRARRRNLNWRQPIQALPMLVIPALATLIYAAFIRFTRTLDLKDNKMIQRLQEEKQTNDCVLREFDQDEQNSAKKYDCTDDPSNFSAAVASAETSKLGTSRQLGINLKDNGGSGTDMAWDHSKDFQPTHSDDVQWRRFSVEETCMTNNNAVIQPIDWVSERVADNSKHLDDMPRRVGHLCTSGTDVGENSMTYSSAETDTCLPDCNIVHINSNTMDHAECSTPMNNPKCNRGVAEENSVRIALTGPMTDLPAFAELLDEGVQENESSKFYVSQENGMPSISKTEVLVGSYAIKNTEHYLETSGFSFCSQETEKEDAAAGVCFVSINPALTFLSSPELVVKGSKYASKKEINTQYENDVVVNSEEEAFVISTDKQCSGTPGFFLHDQDSNMVETPSVVDIVAVRPEPNYPAPAESLTYALDDVDFKEDETSNVHLLEQKGEEVFLDPLLADSYEDSFAISKLLSHSEAAKMTDVAGEDLSESLDKGASSHQNNVAVSSDYGGRTDNMIWDVQLTTESNILEAHQDGKETLSDSIHHSNSHSAGIFLSPSKLINDEAYLSNSHSYFLYSNLMEDESPLPGHGGCRESKDGIDLAFLDTPILLDEVTSAESWTDNAVCSRYVQDNGSTESLHDGNQVQTKTSERANFGFEERFVSSEEGIKSEIFSLYSRSSSCVSDVNMIETLTGVTFPEPKNDNNFSVVERNPMKDPKIFHADSYTNNTRSAEFIADINVMENLNAGKEAGAGSVHDVSLSFLNTLGASDVSCSIGKTDNSDSLSSSFVPEVDTFKGLQAGQRFSEQQYENDFAFCKVEVFPKEVKDDEDFLSGTIGDIQCSKETSFYARSGLSQSQDDEFTVYSTCMSTDGISNAENYLISDSDLHNIVESHCFIENMFPETQPQDPLSFGKAVVDPGELCVSENNPDNSKSSLCSHMDSYQRATPRQQDESNLGFEEIDMGHQGATSKSPLNSLGYQCVSDSNMVKNLEMLQSAQSSSPEILHDSSLCVGSSISVDGGNNFNNSSYNPGSVMHTAEMNTDNFLGLKEGVGEKTVVSISQHEVDTTETNCSNWMYAEATMSGAVKHVNKHPSHSQDEYPVTSFSSDRDSSSMNYSNYSISSPPMPDENLIQIPGAVKEGSFEPNYEYPSSFEETSTSGSYSYNNPMSSLHASMKVSVRSSRKELPDLVLEDVDRFGEISGDEMSNKSQSENGLSCELTAITEAETLYTKIQDCTEASNIDSTKASNIDSTTEASNVDTTKASESATEGLFETEHHREPELVLNLVGIPFIDEDEGKKTEQDCGSSNADSCHHEIRILETLQELPIAVGTEKGLLEDSNICECNCIDKEPKDLGINDIENDVEDLDVGHKVSPAPSNDALNLYLLY